MTEFYTHSGTERYFDFDEKVCDEENGKALTVKEIVTVLNELNEKYIDEFSLRETLQLELQRIEEENKELKSVLKEVLKLLEEEVDLFSDEATEHDLKAYMELQELDNKDAYYIAIATKKAIKLLKEL